MSFLNLLGGGRKPPASAQPTTKTEAVHAQLFSPSRKDSMDSLTPTRKRPSRAQTDSATLVTQKSQPPRTPALDDAKKASIDDGAIFQSPHARPKVSKASTSLEQEWMEIGKDSSDEDDFPNVHNDDPLPPRDKDRRGSLNQLNDSLILVEDEQVRARRLVEELSATKEKLSELQKQYTARQQQLEVLDRANKAKASQLKAIKEAYDGDSIKVSQEHATAIEAKQRELDDLQKSMELLLQRKSKVWEEKMEMLTQENKVLHEQVSALENQRKRGERKFESMKEEAEATSTDLQILEGNHKILMASHREEQKKLQSRVDDLGYQLKELEKQLKERDNEINNMRIISERADTALHTSEVTVDQKDKALKEAQCTIVALEKAKENLQAHIEEQNAAQRLLVQSKEDVQHQNSLITGRLQVVEKELASYTSGIQQLRTSLEVLRSEAKEANKLALSRTVEVERLQQQVSTLEDELHSKEQELIDAKASRASKSNLEDKIRSLNTTIERLKSDHCIETHHLELQATKERARVSQLEKDVSTYRERLRELQSRLDATEQSRRMLRDQVTRREEENHKSNPDSTSSTVNVGSLNLSSSIIHDSSQSPNDQLYSLLRNLNYEIFQIAALLADCICSIERASSSNNDAATSDLIDEDTTSLLGPHLVSLVRAQSTTPLDTYDPFPLQTAIQATLICCATRVMTAWYPGHWDHSDFLAATHARIREAEGIAASDTWKAMTRARLRPTTSTVVRVVDFLEECLITVFRYAGWPSGNASAAAAVATAPISSSIVEGQTVESLLRDNHERLSALARHSLRINVLLDSISPQLEPAFAEPGSAYDPYMMDRDDGNGTRRPDINDEVVATSEIGLRKAMFEGKDSSSSNRRRIVLKPKVILKSSFEA